MKACEKSFRFGVISSRFVDCLKPKTQNLKLKTGFTYIEMLVVVALVAICFVPLLHMFAQSMDEVMAYSTLGTATLLARDTMEEVKNIRLTKDQIRRTGEVWIPAQKDPPIEMNGTKWRIQRTAVSGTDPLEIRVAVFQYEDLSSPVVELVTIIEDV